MEPMWRARWGWRIALLIVLCAAPAEAQRGDRAAARAAFRRGVDAAREDRWDEALARFREADSLYVSANIRINLAAALVQNLRLLDAEALYARILEDHGRELRGARADEVRQTLAAVTARIPSLEIRLVHARGGERIEVDGAPVEPTDDGAVVRVDPGEHTIVVRRGEEAIERRQVRLAEVASLSVAIRIGPAPRPPPPPVARALNVPAIATLAVGGGIFAGLIGPWVRIPELQADPALEEARMRIGPDMGACGEDASLTVRGICDEALAWEVAQWVLLGASVAALAVGTVLLLVGGLEVEVGRVALRPVLGSGVAGLSVAVPE